MDGEFILDTDASDHAIGAELSQIQDGEPRVIAYGSFALTSEQRRYCTTRKELLAVVRFTKQYRHYLLGRPFIVRTDHSSLTWLLNFKEPQGQLARWMEELSQYNMVLQYRPGKLHGNSDALSRMPQLSYPCNAYRAHVAVKDLPCGGCKYCERADKQWGSFHQDVDDAVPLTTTFWEVRDAGGVGGLQLKSVGEGSPGTAWEVRNAGGGVGFLQEGGCDQRVQDAQGPQSDNPGRRGKSQSEPEYGSADNLQSNNQVQGWGGKPADDDGRSGGKKCHTEEPKICQVTNSQKMESPSSGEGLRDRPWDPGEEEQVNPPGICSFGHMGTGNVLGLDTGP